MSVAIDNNNPPSNDLAELIYFSDVAIRLEKIRNANSSNDKEEKLKRFIVSFNEFRTQFISKGGLAAHASFYPVFRLMLPESDTERKSYGIQTKLLGKLFVKALAINQQSAAAVKLTVRTDDADSDFGDIVFDVMKDRTAYKGTLTVHEVNKYLDAIADHFKNNERNKIDMDLTQALRKMSPLDCKWFTRIVLKKLSLGLGHSRILQFYHPEAADYYNKCSRLSHTCNIIDSGNAAEQRPQSQIELFEPIRPMLCKRELIAQINVLLKKYDYFMETKMDGERFHIHINGKEFKYFSRNCNDGSTNAFGRDSSGGTFSPVLYRLLGGKFRNAILDGEMMVWHRKKEIYLTKTENAAAGNLRRDDPHLNPCFCIYDIIYLDGMSFMDFPYAERYRKLQSLVTETRGHLTLCKRVKIKDAEHLLEYVNNAFDAREEGVVIKQADSTYQPGQRGWFKIKPDYENQLINDFDLLIIGGRYHENRKEIITFLLGVRNANGVFHAVTNVHHGLSDHQLKDILAKLEPFWKKVHSDKTGRSTVNRHPDCIEWNNAAPDVWIEPQNSIILQIKATALVETTKFRTSHSFRFPRVMAIREDKLWSDCCSLSEFETFCSTNSKVEILTKRRATIDDVNESKTFTKKRKPIDSIAGHDDVQQKVERIDNVCDGLDFCILNAGKNKSNDEQLELKTIIWKHGGRVVANPCPKTFACIAGYESYQVENYIKTGKQNIATVNWLRKSFGEKIALQSLPKFHPSEMIYATADLQRQFVDYFDVHGDSYTEESSKNDFKRFCANLRSDHLPTHARSDIIDLEKEIWAPQAPPKHFRYLNALFLPLKNNHESYRDHELAQFIFRTKAGRILQSSYENNAFWSQLTHIFVADNNFDSTQIPCAKHDAGTQIKIVSFKWILECHKANERISDERFIYNENSR